MRKWLLICTLMWLTIPYLSAQELSCRVQINSEKIQGTNKQVFTTLEQAITEYINTRKWSEAQIAVNEKIECSLLIVVKEVDDTRYTCEIQVQSRRPVYNSSYTTTLLNFRDTEFEFTYQEHDPLVYNETTMESNLTGVIDFYVYMMLAIDFDSFSYKGGEPFFRRAEEIVNLGQSTQGSGWTGFGSTRNRHALLTAFIEVRNEPFRRLWYDYHRLGLDEMALSVDKGRAKVTEALNKLVEIYELSSTSVLIPLFSDAKLDEVVNIYSEAPKQEKDAVYKILNRLYPTETRRLEPLRK
ncbi:MAG: DUF4835 family protein [Coprobacter sp.]|nr:DUF4835 family protein [Coprobacter sp.]